MSYNLYQTLNSNIPSTDLTDKQKKEIIDSLSKFDKKTTMAFLLLIREHAKLSGEYTSSDIPYKMIEKKSEKGEIVGNINNFPLELRWILFRFTEAVLQNSHV